MYQNLSSVNVKYSQMPKVKESFFYRIRPYKNPMNIDRDGDLEGLLVSSSQIIIGHMAGKEELWSLCAASDGEAAGRFCNIGTEKYLGYAGNTAVAAAERSAVNLHFDLLDSATNRCNIWAEIGNTKFYLCHNAPSVLWKENGQQGDDESSWGFERLIKIKGIPSAGSDYFSENCGYASCTTMPTAWETGMKKMYCLAFGVGEKEYDDHLSQVYVNLYGARYNTPNSPRFDRRFHPGVDINYEDRALIYAPFDGDILDYNEKGGAVTIKDSSSGFIYTFMHMDLSSESGNTEVRKFISSGGEKPVRITKKSIIGRQSNKNVYDAPMDSHLHVEVVTHEGKLTSIYNASFIEMQDSIPPYPAFNTLALNNKPGNQPGNPNPGGSGGLGNLDEGDLEEGEQGTGSSGGGTSTKSDQQRYYDTMTKILPDCGTSTQSFYNRINKAKTEHVNDPYIYSRLVKAGTPAYKGMVMEKYGLDNTWSDEDIAFFMRYHMQLEAETGE